MRGWLERARLAMFAVLAAAGGVTLATGLDRTAPILVATVSGRMTADAYRPGDLVSGEWSMKAVRVCGGRAERWVRVERADGQPDWFYRPPDAPLQLEDAAGSVPGEISYPIASFGLPADTPVGTARYYHRDFWACSWPGHVFWPIVVTYQPLTFRVEPAPPRQAAGP